MKTVAHAISMGMRKLQGRSADDGKKSREGAVQGDEKSRRRSL